MYAGKKLKICMMLGYLLLFLSLAASHYLIWDATLMIGIGLLPFIWYVAPVREKSIRFWPVVLIFLLGSFYVKEVSFRYLTLLVEILFAIESIYGKVSPLFFWILIIVSPLFKYLSEVFTFPIRLQLTEWAGSILRAAHFPAVVRGNVIQLNGSDFSVDPACMGLQMTGFSLLAGIFLLIHHEKLTKKELSWQLSSLVMLAVFTFNVVSNLMRMIVLVVFNIGPENVLHDVVGIACLLIYVWLPASFFIKYLFQKCAHLPRKVYFPDLPDKSFTLILNAMILICCTMVMFQNRQSNIRVAEKPLTEMSAGYQSSKLSSGVTQFRNNKTLVYIKPIPAFYSTDHSPYTCWKGSGYEFTNIREESVEGRHIYFGTLKKGEDVLHTAWWFSNDRYMTISQLDWRWKAVRGAADFQLINITAGDPNELKIAIRDWMPHI